MLERTITIDLDERTKKEAAAARRFPVSISSEAPVKRRDWETGEQFDEILEHSREAIDLSRAPLPVLEGHDRSRVNIGVVRNLKIDGSRLRGELVLGASQRAQELAEDIAAGIVTGLSVGYEAQKVERDPKRKRLIVKRWMPYETSIVSVPADVTVGINRSQPMEENTTTQQPPVPTTTPSPEVLAERERVSTIRTLVTRNKLGDEFANHLIDRGVTLEMARAAILDKLAERDEAFQTTSHLRIGEERYEAITPGNDYAQEFQRAAVDAILLRSGIRVEKPHAAAGDVSASFYDLARTCLSRSGKSASRWFGGEARGPELIKRAMTTTDFPLILANALHMSVRRGTRRSRARTVRGFAPFRSRTSRNRRVRSSAPLRAWNRFTRPVSITRARCTRTRRATASRSTGRSCP